MRHQLWFSLIPLLCSNHLELNSSRNPLIANHWCLQMQPKNSLLLLPSCLGHLLPVHKIQFILTLLHVNIVLHLHLQLFMTPELITIDRGKMKKANKYSTALLSMTDALASINPNKFNRSKKWKQMKLRRRWKLLSRPIQLNRTTRLFLWWVSCALLMRLWLRGR